MLRKYFEEKTQSFTSHTLTLAVCGSDQKRKLVFFIFAASTFSYFVTGSSCCWWLFISWFSLTSKSADILSIKALLWCIRARDCFFFMSMKKGLRHSLLHVSKKKSFLTNGSVLPLSWGNVTSGHCRPVSFKPEENKSVPFHLDMKRD